MTILDIIDKGGIIMYPILMSSIVSMAVLFEKLWMLRSRKVAPHIELFYKIASKGDIDTLKNTVEGRNDYLSIVLNNVLKDESGENPGRLGQIYGKQMSRIVYRFVDIPGIMATISPLMGLLGTTLGMIKIFSKFTSSGGNPLVLAGGIWEALITTAAGLTVAIPSFIIYRYLNTRADNVMSNMEFYLEKILFYISKRNDC